MGRQDVFAWLACLLLALGEEKAHAEAQDAGELLWQKPDDEKIYACQLVAQAESAEQLNELKLQGEYLRLAKLGQFDFKGTIEQVPFRSGCGEVWIGGCPGGRYGNSWIKMRAGSCGVTGTVTSTETVSSTDTVSSVEITSSTSTRTDSSPAAEGSVSVSVSPNTETSSFTDTDTDTDTEPSTDNGKHHDASEARANAVVTEDPGATPDLSCGQPTEEPGKPEVTKWMKEAAEGIEELEGKFNRKNHYANINMSAEGNPEERGGEEVDAKAKKEISMLAEGLSKENNKVFVLISGRELTTNALSGVGVVSHEGFSRDITSLVMVFGIHENGYFHGDAGALDLSQERAARIEAEKQLKLVRALGTVLARLREGKIITFQCDAHKKAIPVDDVKMPEPPPKCDVPYRVVDWQGVANTEAYIALAQLRARNLGLIGCQLMRLRDVNAERQSRQASLNDMATETVGPGSTGASRPVRNTIQGGGDPFALPPGLQLGNLPQTSIADPSSWKDELLTAFGPPVKKEEEKSEGDKKTDPDAELKSELDLFTRAHKKYRELDGRGRFPRTILDGTDSPLALP